MGLWTAPKAILPHREPLVGGPVRAEAVALADVLVDPTELLFAALLSRIEQLRAKVVGASATRSSRWGRPVVGAVHNTRAGAVVSIKLESKANTITYGLDQAGGGIIPRKLLFTARFDVIVEGHTSSGLQDSLAVHSTHGAVLHAAGRGNGVVGVPLAVADGAGGGAPDRAGRAGVFVEIVELGLAAGGGVVVEDGVLGGAGVAGGVTGRVAVLLAQVLLVVHEPLVAEGGGGHTVRGGVACCKAKPM